MRLRVLAGVLCVSVAVAAVWRATQAPQYPPADLLLKQVLKAERQACYEAEAVITASVDGKSRAATAKLYKLGRASRMEYGPAAGNAIMVTTCHETATYEPAQKILTVSQCCGLVDCKRIGGLLARNYLPIVAGQAITAGRDTWVMSLLSNRGYACRTIWVDAKTHIILRTRDYGSDRKPQFEMTIRKLHPRRTLPVALFRIPSIPSSTACVRMEKCSTLSAISKQLGFTVTTPKYIPEGFVPEGMRICRCECGCGFKSAQIRYTDGLQFISVYQGTGNPGCERCESFVAPTAMGSCSVVRAGNEAVATVRCRRCLVVVVADLPSREMRRIARASL